MIHRLVFFVPSFSNKLWMDWILFRAGIELQALRWTCWSLGPHKKPWSSASRNIAVYKIYTVDPFVACTKVGFAWLQSAVMARSVWYMVHPISSLYVSINFSSHIFFYSCAIPIFLGFYQVQPLFLIEISMLYKLGLQKPLTISRLYIYTFIDIYYKYL